MVVREYKKSLLGFAERRFNMVYVEPEKNEVSFVTFDPVEKKMQTIKFPKNLAIKSRSVGEYRIENLYRLGKYQNEGGEFSRRKVQGFMKIPITGYLVGEGSIKGAFLNKTESNLSWIDRLVLARKSSKYSAVEIDEDDLLRAGVILNNESGDYSYMQERLTEYVGKRLFDWEVGTEGLTVSVINESGVDGLGSDMGSFLTNIGLDVIMVRSGNRESEKTKVAFSPNKQKSLAMELINKVFNFELSSSEEIEEYRADIVFFVGRDALNLF